MTKSFFIFLSACLYGVCCFAEDTIPSETNSRKFDYFFLEALRLKAKDESSNAYNALQYALKIDSASSAALFELSKYYLFLKKDSLALDALQKAVEYSPDNFEYKVSLADLEREMRRFNEAIALYEKLSEEYPAKPEFNFYLSDLYLRINRIDKALQSLNDLENNTGVSEAVSMQKYRLYSYMGEEEKAVGELEKLFFRYPAEAKYPIIIGDVYLQQNDTVRALRYYDEARKLDANSPHYFLSMARYYDYIGNEELMIREIDKALRNPSLDVDVKLEILGKYIQILRKTQKDMESANALLEILLEQHPQEKELNMIYGEFLLTQNKTEAAAFQFRILTEAAPDNIDAWKHWLSILLRDNKMDEVVTVCNEALVYFPNAPEFYFYKGAAYSSKKENTQALEAFKEGLKFVPDNNRNLSANFYGQIGDLYHQLNEKEKAYQSYDKALEYDDSNVWILNNYAYFLSLDKKDLDKAERMSAKCVQIQPDNAGYIDTYAWVFFRKGNYTLAKFYIESALSKNRSNSGEIVEHYGDILFMTGDTGRAVEEWQKALSIKETEGDDTDVLKQKIAERNYKE